MPSSFLSEENFYKFLIDLKQYGIRKNIPNIPVLTGYFLNLFIRQKKIKSVLEIGCANGYSTLWMLEALSKQQGTVTAIDVSTPAIEELQSNLKKVHWEKLVNINFGKAQEVLPNIQGHFDLIFVDAQKRMYATFWDLIQKNIHQNSIIIFDNVQKFPQKTADFWEKIKNQTEFKWLEIAGFNADSFVILWKN